MKGHRAPSSSDTLSTVQRSPSASGGTKARLPLLLIAALLATALLPGCTTGRQSGNGANGGQVTLNANTLRYPLTTEPTTLDPAMVEDGTTIDLLQNVFEGLVKWNEQNAIAPNLAEKWDINNDGKTYTFHLKHGVKFQNGRELTADDFKFSLERACDPNLHSPTAPTYLKDIVGATDRINGKAKEISGVKVIDPYTLQITIDAFKPYWLGDMTYPTGYAVCKAEVEQNGGAVNEKAMSGTGPFKMASFQRGYQVILAANPDYHEGRPQLDYIQRPILKDGATRLNKYEADELDYVVISPQDLDHVMGDPKLKADLHHFPRAEIWYVALNQAAPNSPFGKKEVREAFAMAIDKEEIVRVALKGQVDLANGIVPPAIPNYNSNVTPLPYDPAKARQLLAQAGYPGGKGFPTLPISFRQDQPEVGQTAQVIAGQLKTNLGVDIQMRPMEWAQLLLERTNKSMPLIHLRWAADYLDPQDFLSVMLHTSKRVNGLEDHPENGVGYSNPEFDRLCDQADVEHDPNRRMALYRQAEQIAVNDAPWVPIYFKKDIELVKPRVGHIRDSLFGHLPHLTTTVQH